jgi:RAT1-interacting protein
LTAPYEDRPHEGWEMNVMCVNGTMYLEEQIGEEKIREKYVRPLLNVLSI